MSCLGPKEELLGLLPLLGQTRAEDIANAVQKSLEDKMQLVDLKHKVLWSGKCTELKSQLEDLEVQKCMYVTQQKLTAVKEMQRLSSDRHIRASKPSLE
ncbi:uncharacterized protein TNCV_4264991 [Trichonephila clavipes]|nr:uncharacterized protein TNCV_4264991 [Trichonephila clavipes]